jgi:hypothetical protein
LVTVSSLKKKVNFLSEALFLDEKVYAKLVALNHDNWGKYNGSQFSVLLTTAHTDVLQLFQQSQHNCLRCLLLSGVCIRHHVLSAHLYELEEVLCRNHPQLLEPLSK